MKIKYQYMCVGYRLKTEQMLLPSQPSICPIWTQRRLNKKSEQLSIQQMLDFCNQKRKEQAKTVSENNGTENFPNEIIR